METKIDVVYSFRLNETGFDKKGYLTYLKGKNARAKSSRPRTNDRQVT